MSTKTAKLKPIPPEPETDKKSVISEEKGERKGSVSEQNRKGSISEKRRMSVAPEKKPPQKINPKNIQSVTGNNLAGFMATKRFIKRFSQKNRDRSASSVNLPPKDMEPTYRMIPKVKFDLKSVENLLKQIVDDRFIDMKYHKKYAPTMTRVLAAEIKEKLKELNYERYKWITVVQMGEIKDQGMVSCSRCAWDKNNDNHASYYYKNSSIYVNVTVFGVYREWLIREITFLIKTEMIRKYETTNYCSSFWDYNVSLLHVFKQ